MKGEQMDFLHGMEDKTPIILTFGKETLAIPKGLYNLVLGGAKRRYGQGENIEKVLEDLLNDFNLTKQPISETAMAGMRNQLKEKIAEEIRGKSSWPVH